MRRPFRHLVVHVVVGFVIAQGVVLGVADRSVEAATGTTPEVRVNVDVAMGQTNPDVAATPDGRALIVWDDRLAYPAGWLPTQGIRGAFFDASASRSGGVIEVMQGAERSFGGARVAVSAAGFMVTASGTPFMLPTLRTHYSTGATAPNGAPVPGATVLPYEVRADAAVLPTGNFAVNLTGSIVVLAPDGSLVASNPLVDPGTMEAMKATQMVPSGPGLLLVGYIVSSLQEVLIRTDATGAVTSVREIDLLASVVSWPDGSYVVVTRRDLPSSTVTVARYVDPAGVEGPTRAISAPAYPADGLQLAALADGRFFAAWTDLFGFESPGTTVGIRGQFFDVRADGSVVQAGSDFLVNQYTVGAQAHPSVAAMSDGRVAVVWDSYDPAIDPDSGGISLRIIDPADYTHVAVSPTGKACFPVGGDDGDVAVVNLTPVEAQSPGNGVLLSPDVLPPAVTASNVNFLPGSVDPNVALAPVLEGVVCYLNSASGSVHLVADHLGSIEASAFIPTSEPPIPPGGPVRKVDTRTGVGGFKVGPSGRLCFAVVGSPGDVAVVNLTPVEAEGWGNGQLVSSDVVSPPVASNVNFSAGSFDPNVALAPIGADGRVCFVNSVHTSVHLVADHLGTIRASAYAPAGASGAPVRVVDTRVGLGGARVGSSGRSCFVVAGSPGDVAVVNLTPVNAAGLGNGQLVSSDVVSAPVASNVNFSPGSFDPNVALAPIGVDGRVCFVNSVHTSVDLVADHLGTIRAGSFTLASTDGASRRVLDTRAA